MKNLHLVPAIVGAIAPYVFFFEHFGAAGFDPGSFLGSAFANGAFGGFSVDVLLSSLAFWIYLIGRRCADSSEGDRLDSAPPRRPKHSGPACRTLRAPSVPNSNAGAPSAASRSPSCRSSPAIRSAT